MYSRRAAAEESFLPLVRLTIVSGLWQKPLPLDSNTTVQHEKTKVLGIEHQKQLHFFRSTSESRQRLISFSCFQNFGFSYRASKLCLFSQEMTLEVKVHLVNCSHYWTLFLLRCCLSRGLPVRWMMGLQARKFVTFLLWQRSCCKLNSRIRSQQRLTAIGS